MGPAAAEIRAQRWGSGDAKGRARRPDAAVACGRQSRARDTPRQAMTRSRARRAAAPLFAALTLLAGCSHIVVLHDPLTAAEHNDLGVAYEARGETELARREYARAVRRDPRLPQAWINLGNAAAGGGRWGEAGRCYRRALAVDPDRADAL